MSHILSALERAAADRERQTLPGLRLAPVPPAQADDEQDERGPAAPLPWPLLTLAALVSAGLAAWYFGAGRQPLPPAPAPQPVVQIAPSNALPRAVAPTAAPAASAEPTAPRLSEPAAAAAEPGTGTGPLTRVVAAAEPPRSPPSSDAANGKASSPPSPAPRSRRIHAPEDLPPEIRRELPALAISLWMHSDVPAHRMVVVNGRSYKEGSRIGPHLRLEQIGPDGAVFRYKGWRYRMGN